MYKNKTILVTGGTGSFGNHFVRTVLERFPEVKKIIVYSRDELKQFEMAQKFPLSRYPQIRFFIGDVRDLSRLKLAFEEVDYVIHAAALKLVAAAEYNPLECIKTNVLGAQNVIEAAMATVVSRVVSLSTDKASGPINLYGATKLCADKLFTAAHNIVGSKRNLKFSVVRYGNGIGSRGSVIPLFLKQRLKNLLTITHPEMTRFCVSLDEGVSLALYALENMWGGEIYVPKAPSYRVKNVAEAIAPGCKTQIIGIRPGEKIHEEMITETDSFNAFEFKNCFVIWSAVSAFSDEKYLEENDGKRVSKHFHYGSSTNPHFLTVDQIRNLIVLHMDSNFRAL